MAIRFPRCVAAVRKGQAAQWELADALVAEVKDRKGSGSAIAVFRDVSEEIEREVGETYEPKTLAVDRNIALNFPPSLRRKVEATGVAVAFTAYRYTTPEKIFNVIDTVKAKKKGQKRISVTEDDIVRIQEALDLAAERAHEREIEKQRQQLERARREKEEAEARERKAKTDAERKKAAAAREKAEREMDEARVPPKRNENYRPDPETMPALLVPFDIDAECESAQDIARYVVELLQESSDKLDPDGLKAAEGSITKTIGAWEKALALVQKKRGKVIAFPRRA